MRFRLLSILFSLEILLGLAGCGTPPTDPSATTPAPAGKITELKGLFPKLEKGMTAATVREKLGAPAEIKPMDPPTGHAEIWVYHFEKDVGATQVATGMINVPTFSTGMDGPTTGGAPQLVYSTAKQKSVVTLSLLMFDGRLAAQKAMVEKRTEL